MRCQIQHMKGPSSSHGDQVQAVKFGPDYDRSISRGRYNDKSDNHSQPRLEHV